MTHPTSGQSTRAAGHDQMVEKSTISGSSTGASRKGTSRDDPERRLESVFTAAISASEEVVPRLLHVLCTMLNSRYAVFARQANDRRRRTLVGVRHNGSRIVRIDNLVRSEDFRRALEAPTGNWIVDDESGRRWRGTLRMPLDGLVRGAVVLGGRGCLPSEWRRHEFLQSLATAATPLFAAATRLDKVFEEGARLRRRAARSARGNGDLTDPLAGLSGDELTPRVTEIIGESDAIRRVKHAVLTAARSDVPVLIEGESGTGKELIARAIHAASERRDEPFVCENCGAISEQLVESELFGHVHGAFTGATTDRKGLFERAARGTVFLDEIGEMDLSTQKKLLRVLQEKEVRRVGGQETLTVDFRTVSATNRVLEEQINTGAFREDLYYRLNVATIHAPPLRHRHSDIPLLIEHFNLMLSEDAKRDPLNFTKEAIEMLSLYRWPGNIRELLNEVLYLVSSGHTTIGPEQFSPRVLRCLRRMPSTSPHGRNGGNLLDLERDVIGSAVVAALRRARGNRAEAARTLGITRGALYRRMKRYDIDVG